MKQLLVILSLLVFSACTITPQYRAELDGAPILIKDRANIIEDARKLDLDSIYLVKYNRDVHYTPLRYMDKPKFISKVDTLLDGKVIRTNLTYRVVALNKVQAK